MTHDADSVLPDEIKQHVRGHFGDSHNMVMSEHGPTEYGVSKGQSIANSAQSTAEVPFSTNEDDANPYPGTVMLDGTTAGGRDTDGRDTVQEFTKCTSDNVDIPDKAEDSCLVNTDPIEEKEDSKCNVTT